MLNCFLAEESFWKMPLGEGAFYALFGFAFVALGIALLIGILTLMGFAMKRIHAKKEKAQAEIVPPAVPKEPEKEEDDPVLIAVLTAAVAAAMAEEAAKCEFTVRRIKRISSK